MKTLGKFRDEQKWIGPPWRSQRFDNVDCSDRSAVTTVGDWWRDDVTLCLNSCFSNAYYLATESFRIEPTSDAYTATRNGALLITFALDISSGREILNQTLVGIALINVRFPVAFTWVSVRVSAASEYPETDRVCHDGAGDAESGNQDGRRETSEYIVWLQVREKISCTRCSQFQQILTNLSRTRRYPT